MKARHRASLIALLAIIDVVAVTFAISAAVACL